MNSSTTTRKRNPRGEGARLRDEILHAAVELIDAGGAEAVTLRAVAREAGISAPSIYQHFADRDEILTAVVERCFIDLTAALDAAMEAVQDPVDRLRALSAGYLQYTDRYPQRYGLLFRVNGRAGATLDGYAQAARTAFGTLVSGIADCAAAGQSSSTDPFADAAALWSALHGYAALRTSIPTFPWPDNEHTITTIVDGLARIRQPH